MVVLVVVVAVVVAVMTTTVTVSTIYVLIYDCRIHNEISISDDDMHFQMNQHYPPITTAHRIISMKGIN